MQTQFILRMVLAVLAIEYANAETIERWKDFELRINSKVQISYIENQDEISDLLKKIGLIADDKSEVFFHHEEDYIDLSCFNCIIINSSNDMEELGPGNDFITR